MSNTHYQDRQRALIRALKERYTPGYVESDFDRWLAGEDWQELGAGYLLDFTRGSFDLYELKGVLSILPYDLPGFAYAWHDRGAEHVLLDGERKAIRSCNLHGIDISSSYDGLMLIPYDVLCQQYTWPDGTPCGVQEDKAEDE